jgi:hypothetical protein
MFKWLFFLPVIVFVDPFLLYWVWPYLSTWVQAGGLLVYPLAATVYLRNRRIDDGDIATRVLRTGLRFLVWYPGPISKFLTLIFLLPPVERALAGAATRHLQQHLLRGVGQPGAGGRVPPGATGVPFTVPDGTQDAEKLKRAKGRVVE